MRHDRSISQEELAAIAGVNRTYIGMVERGEKNVTIVTLLRLAEALGARPADLLEGIHLGK
jgi:transcriptional regulator with XRE-family HTH domain